MSTPAQPATPTLTLSTDKQVYVTGDTLTLTAAYADDASSPVQLTITATATDASGSTVNATSQVTVTESAPQPMTVTAADSFGDTYSLVSNDSAGTAVLTAVVGTPPAAPAPAPAS
jgi:hypothetical protein